MDSFDKKIIDLMGQNAQQSSEMLAKQLKVSSATVRRRIKKLVQNKVIRIVALADPSKVGAPLAAFIALDVDHNKLDTVMERLANRPEVKWVSSSTGRFDILALTRFSSTDELSDFMQAELANLEGVRNSETFICLKIRKGLYESLFSASSA